MEAPFFMADNGNFALRLHYATLWAFDLDEYMFLPMFQNIEWIPPDEHILNILNHSVALDYYSNHDLILIFYIFYLFYWINRHLFRLLLYDEIEVQSVGNLLTL